MAGPITTRCGKEATRYGCLQSVEVYDPEFFIDFAFAKQKPATLVGAPACCSLSTDKPTDANFPAEFFKLDQNFATSEANIGMGASFANKIMVTCP